MASGPLRVVLLDTSDDEFDDDDEQWLDQELSEHRATPTLIAVHQPPFETGISWMDCVGLNGADRFERVVRRHHQVIKVVSGHVHRLIQTSWGSCSLWVCPSTSVTVAADIDPEHEPAETAEPPAFSLHAFMGRTFVSHLVPVGPTAERSLIRDTAPDFSCTIRGSPTGAASPDIARSFRDLRGVTGTNWQRAAERARRVRSRPGWRASPRARWRS